MNKDGTAVFSGFLCIYELRDTSDEDMYYPLGIFNTVDDAKMVIAKYESLGEAITEHGRDGEIDQEQLTLYRRPFGLSDNVEMVLRVDREQYNDEERDEYLWRIVSQEKAMSDVLEMQIGGSHYKDQRIQPVEYIDANDLKFLEGCIVKRISRHDKPTGKGLEDLHKIIHEVQLIIQLRYTNLEDQPATKNKV